MIDLARKGTIRAAARNRAPVDIARGAKRTLAAQPQRKTPAALALEEALRGVKSGRNRFKVVPKDQRTIDGRVFASGLEAQHYAGLKLQERLGEIRDIVCQPSWRLDVEGVHIGTYTADFGFTVVATGRREIIEVKSSGTKKDAAYRLRRRLAQALHKIAVVEVVL